MLFHNYFPFTKKEFIEILAKDLAEVQPIDIRMPELGYESIFTWSYEKQIFENNAKYRWEDDGGRCV